MGHGARSSLRDRCFTGTRLSLGAGVLGSLPLSRRILFRWYSSSDVSLSLSLSLSQPSRSCVLEHHKLPKSLQVQLLPSMEAPARLIHCIHGRCIRFPSYTVHLHKPIPRSNNLISGLHARLLSDQTANEISFAVYTAAYCMDDMDALTSVFGDSHLANQMLAQNCVEELIPSSILSRKLVLIGGNAP